jgi:iron complex transport system ATP-binding protein
VISVSIRNLSVMYDEAPAVQDLSFDVAAGTSTVLIGPNGAGKTTVLRAIAGLLGFAGEIDIGGRSVRTSRRKPLSRTVAYVPQRPTLPTGATVSDYVLMGRNPYVSYLGTESGADLDVVRNVLNRLELKDLAGRELGSLSGGEAQRAVIGRALAQQPSLLLLDEPTSALDIGHQQQVLELVETLRAEDGLTVVSTMHDLTLAGLYSDKLLLLDSGRAIAHGVATDVLRSDAILRYYGASVEVLSTSSGLVVAPVRSGGRA